MHKGLTPPVTWSRHIWDLHAIYLLKVKPILFPPAWLHQTLSLEHSKILSRLNLQNLRSSTFFHQIHVKILLNLVKEDNTQWEWYLYIHLVISDRGFADITLSLFVKHILLFTLKKNIFYICYGLVHRLSTLKLLLFMASKEWHCPYKTCQDMCEEFFRVTTNKKQVAFVDLILLFCQLSGLVN